MVSTTTIAVGPQTSSVNNHPHEQQQHYGHHQQQQQQQQHHHHHHHQSLATTATATTPTAVTATAAANSSNYQRSTAPASAAVGVALAAQHYPSSSAAPAASARNSYYYSALSLNSAVGAVPDAATKSNTNNNNNHNNNKHSQLGSSASEHQRPSTLNNGKGVGGHPDVTLKPDHSTAKHQRRNDPSSEKPPAVNLLSTSATTTSASASAATSASASVPQPPLNDQISLLFPKCRPKQHHQHQQQEQPQHALSHTSTHSSSANGNDSGGGNNSLTSAEANEHNNNSSGKPTSPGSYYKSVNIITQSPPPASTSSVSSESLSSVTPRISTNPFLSSASNNAHDTASTGGAHNVVALVNGEDGQIGGESNLAIDDLNDSSRNDIQQGAGGLSIGVAELRREGQQQQQQQQQQQHAEAAAAADAGADEDEDDEDLPVPAYPAAFYYHTSSPAANTNSHRRRRLQQQQHHQQQQQQQHHQQQRLRVSTVGEEQHHNYEMPRKRISNYVPAAGQHQLQQQQQSPTTQQQLQQAQMMLATANQAQQHHQEQQQVHGTSAGGGQNPFIKDNSYWESRHSNASNITPTNPLHNPQEYNGGGGANGALAPATSATAAAPTSTRRAYHQQQPVYLSVRQQQHHQQQQQHHIRLGRSPLNRSARDEQQQQQHMELLSTSRNADYHSHHHQQQEQTVQNACAEGLTPLASHYLYGSKNALEHQQQQHQWEKRERAERDGRERDREQREQRKAAAAAAAAAAASASAKSTATSAYATTIAAAVEHERERERDRDRDKGLVVVGGGGGGDRERELREYIGHQQVQRGGSTTNTNNSGLNPISNGEVVVFDDITESWQNLRVTTDTANSADLLAVQAAIASPTATTMQPAAVDTTPIKQQQQQHQYQYPRKATAVTTIDTREPIYDDVEECVGAVVTEEVQRLGRGATVIAPTANTALIYNTKEAHKRYGERYTIAVETRHGIIEYEGSPRRIGQSGGSNSLPDDDDDDDVENDEDADIADGGIELEVRPIVQQQPQHFAKINTNTNSPQQYAAPRPGFPQRIISPPQESTTPIIGHNYNHNTSTNIMKAQQQLPQQQHSQTLPLQQQSPIIDNAEDTSNDVSEIGTLSDLTTPEAISATAAALTVSGVLANNEVHNTTATITGNIAEVLASGGGVVGVGGIGVIDSGLPTKSSTFDYLYEFSETRKVLEEFFKCASNDDEKRIENGSDVDSIDIQYEFHSNLDRDIDADVDEEDEIGGVEEDGVDVDDDEGDVNTRNIVTHAPHADINEDVDDDEDDEEVEVQMDNIHQHLPQQQSNMHYQLEQQQRYSTTPTASYPYQPQPQTPKPTTLLNNHHHHHHQRRHFTGSPLMRDFDFFLDSASRSSGEQNEQQDSVNHNQLDGSRHNYRYSPETTDYDSNCGDLDSLSGEINGVSTSCSNYAKYYASSMPVLEDGLSSGHTSDTENNNNHNHINTLQQQTNSGIHHTPIGGGISMLMDMKRISTNNSINSMNNLTTSTTDGGCGITGMMMETNKRNSSMSPMDGMSHEGALSSSFMRKNDSPINGLLEDMSGRESSSMRSLRRERVERESRDRELLGQSPSNNCNSKVFKNIDPELDSLYSISVFHRTDMVQMTPPPPAPAPHRKPSANVLNTSTDADILQPTPYKDLRSTTSPTNLTSSGSVTTAPSTSSVAPPPPSSASIATAISSTLNRTKFTTHATSGNSSSVAAAAALAAQQTLNNTAGIVSVGRGCIGGGSGTQPPPIPERNLQRTPSPVINSPVWLPRHLDNSANKSLLESSSDNHSKNLSGDEEDVDTDLETDRLLGHQRLDDQGYYDENKSWERKPARSLLSKISPKQQMPSTKTRNGYNALLSSTPEIPPPPIPPKSSTTNKLLDLGGSRTSSEHSDKSPIKSIEAQDCVVAMGSPGGSEGSGCISGSGGGGVINGINQTSSGTGLVGLKKEPDLMNSTNGNQNGGAGNGGVTNSGTGNVGGGNNSVAGSNSTTGEKKVKKSKNKEGGAVLIEGVLFRAKYLGSTQLVCEGQPTKSTRMMQAEEAVSRIKAPDGDVQPSTEVDLFISTEKIMVLNTDLKEIMMDHALRTISYIADIGDLVVLMARRRFVPQDIDDAPKPNRTPKMICHVFESDEAQFIAQSIGQAFQVAYMEFLKANGIEDHSFVKEMDYQEVLNSQEIFGDELEIFAKKELQKEVVVPKAKGEILGVVIVESGWGSMLPTVVIANLMSSGAAARCGQLNIGDQLIAINGLSLVGLPLSTCQTYIKNTKNQTVVKFTVVPCAPVVEVKIKRPNTKYQLGFSVQNGVICSLLRGGIAERGGVRVGHRIIEINNQSVVAVPHEKIVNLLATSVGEILMKTMPTSMFRLLTGQENPIYI